MMNVILHPFAQPGTHSWPVLKGIQQPLYKRPVPHHEAWPLEPWEVIQMNTIQQSAAVLLNEEELAGVLTKLIRTNPKLISAVFETVCSCPNLVVQC